ncbi:hypothetical protein GALL_357220 [mine drainage metagenome]|uniref:Uncharacterized protein n=1 Tax=mine drainage metagenome TaxID=410659 RepID=A0A1J5QRI6_9ZZZZ
MCRQLVEERQDFITRIDRIQVHAGNRQMAGEIQVILQSSEIGGQQQFDAAGFEVMVRKVQRMLPVGI